MKLGDMVKYTIVSDDGTEGTEPSYGLVVGEPDKHPDYPQAAKVAFLSGACWISTKFLEVVSEAR